MTSALHSGVRGVVIGLAGLAPAGPIRAGNGGHNLDWSWRFTRDVALAEVTIELCDGRPSMVEADLGYWLRTVGSFCPWGSYVHAEVQ